ncbi:hypothetical protein BDE40_1519 [Litoreibacter halocynthiae]|uniref:Uncharacterized protein n=1 Tax=Litoreibacter halocynthiae TaxID=1242689 RepID=A0A4R7LJK3_9RHOB|nr:hypothetical protein [Litoreibacter halocynthiae]TDT74802.1 hypothetical protein BDE40_1519 [Litoreibacter halocynthiae]
MRKTFIVAIVAIAGLVIVAKIGWGVWKGYMGQLENNENCTFYNEVDYQLQLKWVNGIAVPEPANPFPVRVTFELNGLPHNISRMIFNHGTAPITPPTYESAEYVGPFQLTMDFLLSDTRNEWPFSFHPAVGLFYDDERAVCFWDSGEVAEYIQDSRGHPHFKLELLPYRRVDVMSGYNLQLVK